jgi:hypothetical protein
VIPKAFCVLTLAAVAVTVHACPQPALQTSQEPSRPASIPASAFWLGGADGGVFVSVAMASENTQRQYQASIYHATGDLWYRGRLSLEPLSAPAFDHRKPSSYTAWDGDTLHLENGGRLKALDPIGSHRSPPSRGGAGRKLR